MFVREDSLEEGLVRSVLIMREAPQEGKKTLLSSGSPGTLLKIQTPGPNPRESDSVSLG